MTFWFYIILYLIGLFFVLPLSRKLPFWLLVCTGFIWGMLLWIACSTVSLLIGLTYSWRSMSYLLAPLVFAAAGLNIYHKTLLLTARQIAIFLLGVGSTALLAYIVTQNSYVFTTEDSFSIILLGRDLANSGLETWSVNRIADRGLISPVFQMSSHLLQGDFISGYQTLLAATLVSFFSIGIFQHFRNHFKSIVSFMLTCLVVLVCSTIIFIEHAFYIHTNLTAAVFLLVAVYSLLHFLHSEISEWLIIGNIAIIGFGFSRMEGPLFVILFLALVISLKQIKHNHILIIVLPYTIIAFLWHTFLYFCVNQAGLLNQSHIIIIMLALLGLMILGIVSKWIPKALSKIPNLVIGTLSVGLLVAFFLKPDHMFTSTYHVFLNLGQNNSWGLSWIVILSILPLVLESEKQHPENRFLKYGILGYIQLVLILAFFRTPYRLGPTDSANRIILQIQPIIFLFIAVKIGKLKEWFIASKKP